MRKNIVFAFLIAITLAIAAGCNQYVLLPYPVPGGSSTQSDNIYVISGDIGNVNLQNIINNYDGIKGESKESPTQIPVKEPLIIAKDFTFEAVELTPAATSGASLFAARSDENKELPIGINLSGSTDDITLTIRDSKISGFGYAIMSNKANGSKEDDPNSSVNPGSLTLIIENSDFSDCFKGLYATDIKDLTVTDSTFTNMGTDAFGEDVVTRSGSAIDINQMSAGGTITITGSRFTNCGDEAGTTSGAIKVKVRGAEDDKATDIPAICHGSLGNLIIKDCTFSDNRRDVVLGTSQYASTAGFKYDIQEDCDVENNSLNYYILTESKKYSEIKSAIADEYIGIKGKSSSEVVLTIDEPVYLERDFAFENIALKGNAESPYDKENPHGIDFKDSTEDVTLTLKHVKMSEFGYAISSNKANGRKDTDPNSNVNPGSLTLVIDRSEFRNCFKGLYATDIRNLTITNSKFSNMGEASEGTDVVKRSGSAIDVNQMIYGESIKIMNSEFTNCGKEGNEETTSGAIKVKVRGGEDDEATDIPAICSGSFSEGLTVSGCIFSDNRADVVIGTSSYESTGKFTADIQKQDSQGHTVTIEYNNLKSADTTTAD